MNISIGEKKVFGGAAPRYKRLEDYRRCRGVIGGLLLSDQLSPSTPYQGIHLIGMSHIRYHLDP